MDLMRLENWVTANDEAANALTINLTTGKEFTIRGIFEQLKKAKEEEIEIVDEEVIAIRDQIEEWLGGI